MIISNSVMVSLIIGYFLILGIGVWKYAGIIGNKNKENFLVANRNIGIFEGGMSIGATWLWVFALIMAPFFAYIKGWVGLFWFAFPNTLAIACLGFLAYKLLEKYPNGFTFSSVMRETYSKRTQGIYQVMFILLAIYAGTMNFTAVGLVLGSSSTVPVWVITGLLAIGTLIYSWWGGLKASIFTDKVQMFALLVASVVIIPIVLYSVGFSGLDMNGKFNINSLFDLNTMLKPGLLLLILLSASALADQSFYQRMFAMGGKNGENKDNVKKAFFIGAAVFGFVIVMFGLLGLAAQGMGITGNPKVAWITMVTTYAGPVGFCILAIAVLAAIGSTVDSHLNSAGSVVANDWFPNVSEDKTVLISRLTMTAAIVLAWVLSTFQIDIWVLILVYGVMRTAAISTSLFTVFKPKFLNDRGAFYGILSGVVVGLSINLSHIVWKVGPGPLWGAIVALLIPVVVSVVVSKSCVLNSQTTR
tara:strand:+ start:5711 stop:7129 length:1419 start_codon:yes stop_codon:yes gene_type:complete